MNKIAFALVALLSLGACEFYEDPLYEGVDVELMLVLEDAATDVHFKLREGLRSFDTQQDYFNSGASQTLYSRHLTGHAMDITALVDGVVSWDAEAYILLAERIREAAVRWDVDIRWGGSWTVLNTEKSARDAYEKYVIRNSSPFLDFGHFEIAKEK